MTRARPYVPGLLFVVLAAATVVSGCGPSGAVPPDGPPRMPTVTVAHPEKSAVQDYLDYTGRIEPSQRVEVRSRVALTIWVEIITARCWPTGLVPEDGRDFSGWFAA